MNRRLILTAVGAGAIALAACGSGDDDTAESTGAASAGTPGATQSVEVAEVDGIGAVLVDSTGMALYTADEEADGEVRCVDTCTEFWEPLVAADGAPTAAPEAGTLGVTERPDGTQQVTADGRPLYTFVQDSPGNVTGDGFEDDFGDQHLTWHAVRPAGATPPAESTPEQSEGGVPGYGG